MTLRFARDAVIPQEVAMPDLIPIAAAFARLTLMDTRAGGVRLRSLLSVPLAR